MQANLTASQTWGPKYDTEVIGGNYNCQGFVIDHGSGTVVAIDLKFHAQGTGSMNTFAIESEGVDFTNFDNPTYFDFCGDIIDIDYVNVRTAEMGRLYITVDTSVGQSLNRAFSGWEIGSDLYLEFTMGYIEINITN